jgi:acetone carboxylase gamma subunit
MLLRIRKYLCPGCGGVVKVKAKTKSVPSWCDRSQKDVRLKLISKVKS